MADALLCSRVGPESIAARLVDGRVVELVVDQADPDLRAGNLLELRVANVVAGIQSAFLELRQEPNAYLNVDDLRSERGSDGDGPIEQRLTEGQRLLVRVEREPLGGKGPRVRTEPGVAGHLLVYLPWGTAHKVSRRIRDERERKRLLAAVAGRIAGDGEDGIGIAGGVADAEAGDGGAFLVRTAAAGASSETLASEGARLRRRWDEIRAAMGRGAVPAVRHREPPPRLRLLRDLERLDGVRIACDDARDRDDAVALLRERDPAAAARVELHPLPGGLFEEGGLRRTLERALRRRVWLPSGGSLAIEETEALVAIDVNTGRNLGRGGAGADGARRTVLETNVEACAEIARQVRLRDLGGIVAVDFIDMADPAERARVREALREGLIGDPGRSAVGAFSERGILEFSRRRTRANLRELLTEDASVCGVEGRRPQPRRIALEIYRALLARPAVRVEAHPDVVEEIRGRRARGERSTVDLDAVDWVARPEWSRERFAPGS